MHLNKNLTRSNNNLNHSIPTTIHLVVIIPILMATIKQMVTIKHRAILRKVLSIIIHPNSVRTKLTYFHKILLRKDL